MNRRFKIRRDRHARCQSQQRSALNQSLRNNFLRPQQGTEPRKIEHNRVRRRILHTRRNRPPQIHQRRMSSFFQHRRTQPNLHRAKILSLRFRHAQFNSSPQSRVIRCHHLSQRRRSLKKRNRAIAQPRLRPHHRLHHKIRNVNRSKPHIQK